MAKILSVRGLSKKYGNITALDTVSFEVNHKEIVGLLGPNGAGKTTTINIILGVLAADSGDVHIDGLSLSSSRSKAIAETNFAAVYTPLPGNLTLVQNLRIFARLYSVKDAAARIDTVIRQFDLEPFRDKKCGVLSSGEQTRAGLAKAMLNRPRLLLLDEPTASLDPATAREIRLNIRKYTEESEAGVLWTSHNMYEVEAICDRVLFLSHGKVLLEGNPKTLPAEHHKKTLEDLFIAVAREPLTLEA
ncbi:MAG: ABC transporter ATP-binding protein [Candidatus Omnitrophica bacterium]|nr:ABC transporter ATP-binding protein [Candidatus Omnitrophota bacterium]